MKLALAMIVLLASAPALAQSTTPAPAPKSSSTVGADAPAAPAAARFTLDTPLEAIVADPAGKAVIDADLPGTTSHPMYEQFKSMSLTQLQPMSGGKLTDEAMAKVKTDLAALK